ncbi:MAG: hypothetical protein QM750_00145 [Rubrivivax sp.]
MTGVTLQQLLSELSVLVDEVTAQREDIQFLTRRLLAAEDRATLAELLPLVAAVMGGAAWTASDLAGRAVTGTSTAAGALSELIARQDSAAGGLRAFGRLLSRIEGAPAGGMRLVRVGTTSRTAVYRLHGFEGPETTLAHGAGASV